LGYLPSFVTYPQVVGAATQILGIMEERARMKASREGEGAQIVANRTVPKEAIWRFKKSLELMCCKCFVHVVFVPLRVFISVLLSIYKAIGTS